MSLMFTSCTERPRTDFVLAFLEQIEIDRNRFLFWFFHTFNILEHLASKHNKVIFITIHPRDTFSSYWIFFKNSDISQCCLQKRFSGSNNEQPIFNIQIKRTKTISMNYYLRRNSRNPLQNYGNEDARTLSNKQLFKGEHCTPPTD